MNKWVLAEALDNIIDHTADNKDWDFYWKVRHFIEETYVCKFDTKHYGLDNMFTWHRFTEDGTLK